ncbi:DUF1018 domain-containing protein [bacterium]|nr:DUF1018 domain-containing protein [bacterium]
MTKRDANAGYDPAQQTKSAVTKEQIKQIHTLKGKLGWDDDFYRMVLGKYNVKSSKEMTCSQANRLISEMMRAAGVMPDAKAGYYPAQSTKSKVVKPTKAQVYAITAIWSRVSRAEGSEAKRAALDSFIYNKFGKTLETLTRAEASKVIVILKKMEEKDEKRQ